MLPIINYYNTKPDPRWDNKLINYDTEKYPWSEWVLSEVKKLKPNLDSLTNIHQHFALDEMINLRKKLEKLSNSKEFSKLLDSFFEEYIHPNIDFKEYLIQSTVGIRLVIPNQAKKGRLLSFHTGYWTGYNNDMGTAWIPLTKCFSSNTMQVLSWEDSAKLMKKIHNEQLSLDEIQSLCEEKMYPVELDVGQSWLFGQGHLHGNVNNETNVTRVSFDARYALSDTDFGIRRAGSFFRFPGTAHTFNKNEIFSKDNWVVFVDQNSSYVGTTPHFIIREFLLEYAKRLDLSIVEWSNEYWGCTWMPKFADYCNSNSISGILMPSIYALSGDREKIISMLKVALSNNIQVMFADEEIFVRNIKDLDHIEKIYALCEKT